MKKHLIAVGTPAVLAVLLATIVPRAAPGQERVNTDSLKRSYRAELEEYRRLVARGALVFLDSSRSISERLSAVQGVGAMVEVQQVARTKAMLFDMSESPRIRIRALLLVENAAYDDTAMVVNMLALLEDVGTPMQLRLTVGSVVQVLLMGSFTKHVLSEEMVATFRTLTRDQDDGLRSIAFAVLAGRADGPVLEQLAVGLRDPTSAPLSPAESVRLLGTWDPNPDYSLLHDIMLEPPDLETRLEAVRLLGGYAPSQQHIVRYLHDPNEREDIRLAAVGTLSANDPQNFARHVLPIVRDETERTSLRVYGIQAVMQRRSTRDFQTRVARVPDEFDMAVSRLARESQDGVVRQAAVRYMERVTQNDFL